MRIGIDARILTLPELRGMAAYLMEILKAWPEQKDSFVFFTEQMPVHGNFTLKNSVQWQVIPSPRGSRIHIWDWWALPRFLEQNPTMVDLFWSPANLTFPLKGLSQVVTLHDTLLQERVKFKDFIDQAYYRYWLPGITRCCAHGVITVSRFSASRIKKIFHYPGTKIHVIPNGATLVHESVNREKTNRILTRSGVTPFSYIYALGAESPWKNTLGVLRSFARIRTSIPGISLVLSGVQDRFMDQVWSECKILGLDRGDAVMLMGYVDDMTRDSLYAGAALFVYPSLFEGFGLPPLEAMSLGAPVVASHAASIPEVVGRAALLVDASDTEALANAMVRVLQDKELGMDLMARGKRHITRFQWETAACRHRHIMAEMVNNP